MHATVPAGSILIDKGGYIGVSQLMPQPYMPACTFEMASWLLMACGGMQIAGSWSHDLAGLSHVVQTKCCADCFHHVARVQWRTSCMSTIARGVAQRARHAWPSAHMI